MHVLLLFVSSLQKKAKAAADVEYPAYGVTGIAHIYNVDSKIYMIYFWISCELLSQFI